MKNLLIHEEMLSEQDGVTGLLIDSSFFPVKMFFMEGAIRGSVFPNKQAEALIEKLENEIAEYIGDGLQGIVHSLSAKIKPRNHVTITSTVIRLPVDETLYFTFKRKLNANDILRDYPISVQHVMDDEDNFWIAWLPDFGFSACSCPGETPTEAIEGLAKVVVDVVQYYNEKGKELPRSTPFIGDADILRLPSGEMIDLNQVDVYEVETHTGRRGNLLFYQNGYIIHNEEVTKPEFTKMADRLEVVRRR